MKKGELFAFLGINGAGKSTTINIMCGQLSKDSGSVFIDKHDLDKDTDYIKRELGVVFQSSVLDSALSVPNTKAATELIIRNPQLFNDYEITKGKMDDVFLAVTGKTLVGGAEK